MIKPIVGAEILVVKQKYAKGESPRNIFTGYEGVRYTNILASAKISPQRYSTGILKTEYTVTNEEVLEEIKQHITTHKPKLILAFGDSAFKTLTGYKNFEDFRGTFITTDLGIPILGTYDFGRMITEPPMEFVALMDCRKARRFINNPETINEQKDFIPSATLNEILAYIKERKEERGEVVLDIENTYGPETHITQVGLSHSPNQGITFNTIRQDWSIQEEVEFWTVLADLLEDSKIKLIMQNGKHDAIILWKNRHILCANFWFDTLIAGQLCWPELKKGLSFLSSLLLSVPAWKHDSANPYYNVQDVANTFGIYIELKKTLEDRDMLDFFFGKMREVDFACRAEMRGLRIDTEEHKKLITTFETRLNELNTAFISLTSQYGTYNIASPKQLGELLYDKLNLPRQYKRRKSVSEDRKATTDSEALLKLSDKTKNPILKLILEIKRTSKRFSYFKNLRLSPENRVHTSFSIDSASEVESKALGRWSSSKSIIYPFGSGKDGKMNIYSIPRSLKFNHITKKAEEDRTRRLFIPEPGNVLVQADYAIAEAVFIAYYSNDKTMIDIINAKGDIHKKKASELLGIPESEVTPEQRQGIGKIVRHSTNYKGGPEVIFTRMLDSGIETTRAECKRMFTKNLALSLPLQYYHKEVETELRTQKFLTNHLGRKRYYLGKIDDKALKNGYAFKPQSGVGDVLNLALKKFYFTYGSKWDVWFPVYDSIMAECPPEEVEECKKAMFECMNIPITVKGNTFTLGIDFKVGDSWGGLKDAKS